MSLRWGHRQHPGDPGQPALRVRGHLILADGTERTRRVPGSQTGLELGDLREGIAYLVRVSALVGGREGSAATLTIHLSKSMPGFGTGSPRTVFPPWHAFLLCPPASPQGAGAAAGPLWAPRGDTVVLCGGAEYPAVGSISELRVTEAGPSQLRVTWRGLPGAGGYLLTWRSSDGECGDHGVQGRQRWSPSHPGHLS